MSYVYTELTEHQIADKLLADDNADWTYEQARALADYLIICAENAKMPLALDYVAIRRDFSAYPSALEALSEYQDTAGLDESSALEMLYEHNSVLHATVLQCDDGTIIIENY
jgi:hypothetical protein